MRRLPLCPGVGWASQARVRAVGERLGRRDMQFYGTNAVLEVPAKACLRAPLSGCPLPHRPSASQAGVNNTKLGGTQACQRVRRGVAHFLPAYHCSIPARRPAFPMVAPAAFPHAVSRAGLSLDLLRLSAYACATIKLLDVMHALLPRCNLIVMATPWGPGRDHSSHCTRHLKPPEANSQ